MKIKIEGTVGWDVTASGVSAQLDSANGAPVEAKINSGGGNVAEAIAIFTALEAYKGEVTAVVGGIAASAAAYIMLAADKVSAYRDSLFLFHNAWGFTIGNEADHLATAATLKTFTSPIVNAVMKRTGKSEEDAVAFIAEDRWMTASEALEMGIIDEITDSSTTSPSAAVYAAAMGIPAAMLPTAPTAAPVAPVAAIGDHPLPEPLPHPAASLPAQIAAMADQAGLSTYTPGFVLSEQITDEASAMLVIDNAKEIHILGKFAGADQSAIDNAIKAEMPIADFRHSLIEARAEQAEESAINSTPSTPTGTSAGKTPEQIADEENRGFWARVLASGQSRFNQGAKT